MLSKEVNTNQRDAHRLFDYILTTSRTLACLPDSQGVRSTEERTRVAGIALHFIAACRRQPGSTFVFQRTRENACEIVELFVVEAMPGGLNPQING